jgi:hypothetical protein
VRPRERTRQCRCQHTQILGNRPIAGKPGWWHVAARPRKVFGDNNLEGRESVLNRVDWSPYRARVFLVPALIELRMSGGRHTPVESECAFPAMSCARGLVLVVEVEYLRASRRIKLLAPASLNSATGLVPGCRRIEPFRRERSTGAAEVDRH